MKTGFIISKEELDQLKKGLKAAVDAGEYVVNLCHDNLAAGDSPNPYVKADWVGTTAHCYAAMNFLPETRKALEILEKHVEQ